MLENIRAIYTDKNFIQTQDNCNYSEIMKLRIIFKQPFLSIDLIIKSLTRDSLDTLNVMYIDFNLPRGSSTS